MKLFNTSDMRTVKECQLIFGFRLPSAILADKSKILLTKYDSCNILLFKLSLLSLWIFGHLILVRVVALLMIDVI